MQSADCVPLLIVDPTTRAVCAAHAGWRGLAAGVPLAAVQALKKNFGSRSADLFVAIGPSIGACCYEVGRDVREAFSSGFSDDDLDRWFSVEPKRVPSQSADAKSPERSPSRSLVFRWLAVGARSAGGRRRPTGPHLFGRALHGEPPACLVFLSTRRHADGPHGGRDQVPAAPSIAALASRSACLLASRRTCSNDTRPISRASSRAFAWSGCSPGCFTL